MTAALQVPYGADSIGDDAAENSEHSISSIINTTNSCLGSPRPQKATPTASPAASPSTPTPAAFAKRTIAAMFRSPPPKHTGRFLRSTRKQNPQQRQQVRSQPRPQPSKMRTAGGDAQLPPPPRLSSPLHVLRKVRAAARSDRKTLLHTTKSVCLANAINSPNYKNARKGQNGDHQQGPQHDAAAAAAPLGPLSPAKSAMVMVDEALDIMRHNPASDAESTAASTMEASSHQNSLASDCASCCSEGTTATAATYISRSGCSIASAAAQVPRHQDRPTREARDEAPQQQSTRRRVKFHLERNTYLESTLVLTSNDIEAAWYHCDDYDRIVHDSMDELRQQPMCNPGWYLDIVNKCRQATCDSFSAQRLRRYASALQRGCAVRTHDGATTPLRGFEVELIPSLRFQRKKHCQAVLQSYHKLQTTQEGSLHADLRDRMLRARSLHLSRPLQLWARVLAEQDMLEAWGV